MFVMSLFWVVLVSKPVPSCQAEPSSVNTERRSWQQDVTLTCLCAVGENKWNQQSMFWHHRPPTVRELSPPDQLRSQRITSALYQESYSSALLNVFIIQPSSGELIFQGWSNTAYIKADESRRALSLRLFSVASTRLKWRLLDVSAQWEASTEAGYNSGSWRISDRMVMKCLLRGLSLDFTERR